MIVKGLDGTSSGLSAAPGGDWAEHWRVKFFEAQKRNEDLEQAVYNYLTAPTKRTLKELWSALHIDGSPPASYRCIHGSPRYLCVLCEVRHTDGTVPDYPSLEAAAAQYDGLEVPE